VSLAAQETKDRNTVKLNTAHHLQQLWYTDLFKPNCNSKFQVWNKT